MFKRLKNFRISSLLDVLWPDDDFWRTPAPKPPSPGLLDKPVERLGEQ